MQIQKIKAENYKTYLHLDLDLRVTDERPIVLIGGMNGGGKTTLFDAIYGALYGLEINTERQFREFFNAGVKDIDNKCIVLEIEFTGYVLSMLKQYRMIRTYKLIGNKPVENVQLYFDSISYNYGTHTAKKERESSEAAVNKIIEANLPRELSKYFLFDAMKTSELVKEEQINNLIKDNIKSVMGFNKYYQLQQAAERLLGEEKAKRLENEQQEKEYKILLKQKEVAEGKLVSLQIEYEKALQYSADNRETYEVLLKGKNDNSIIDGKIETLRKRIETIQRSIEDFQKKMGEVANRNLEISLIIPRIAQVLASEIEIILSNKKQIEDEKRNRLSESQLNVVAKRLIGIIEKKYLEDGTIDMEAVIERYRYETMDEEKVHDRYSYLDGNDIATLQEITNNIIQNPVTPLLQERQRLNLEMEELPKWRSNMLDLKKQKAGGDFSLIEAYENNEKEITRLRTEKQAIEKEILDLKKKIENYDYQVSQEPDPRYDLLCRLPELFKDLARKLLRYKKDNIEQMMKDNLNKNLIAYKDTIGRVDLSQDLDDITFKLYHKEGTEIFINQLNAGSKQMVMQVLLKVLYELGDYDPPVMIDTVMGVLDRLSRETILENYFPDLARQTILLSTDSEITPEKDFKKIETWVSKAYTLHRDLERQCTTITEDYFNIKPRTEEW